MKKINLTFKGSFTICDFAPLDGLYVDNDNERKLLIVCAAAPEVLEALIELCEVCDAEFSNPTITNKAREIIAKAYPS